MKKLFLSALVGCIALLTSCTQDSASPSGGGGGTSTVGKKISQVYEASTSTSYVSNDQVYWEEIYHYSNPSKLEDEWYWDGDKIDQIDHYWGNDEVRCTRYFYYNNAGNVNRIESYYEGELSYYMLFYYNDSKINKFEIYEDNILYEAYELVYSGDKITRANCIYYSDDEKSYDRQISFMKNFQHFKDHKESIQRDDLPYIILTWTGDDITKIREYYPGEGNYTTNYTYDNKNNPYYGSNALTAYAIFDSGITNLSQHNVKSSHSSDGYDYTYSYNYYENYPMQMSYTSEYISGPYDDIWYKDCYEYRFSFNYLVEE